MRLIFLIFCYILQFVLQIIECQECISITGETTQWWVSLIFPKNIPQQYLYFDSTFEKPQFRIRSEHADSPGTSLFKTLNQMNKMNLKFMAWNDQLPNGTTTSSKAHSKGILVFNNEFSKGFYLGHSFPQFPNFVNNQVIPTIGQSQRLYGQHAFCISLYGIIIKQFINKLIPIRPLIYATNLGSNQLMGFSQVQPPNYNSILSYKNYSLGGNDMKFVFKNGGHKGSIFENGLNIMLNSAIYVQSWGRPLQKPWCSNRLSVINILSIRVNSVIFWNQTKDHSKWLYAAKNNYSCFGDLNRMESQQKRGGAYYCIDSYNLNRALAAITAQTDKKVCYEELYTIRRSFMLILIFIAAAFLIL